MRNYTYKEKGYKSKQTKGSMYEDFVKRTYPEKIAEKIVKGFRRGNVSEEWTREDWANLKKVKGSGSRFWRRPKKNEKEKPKKNKI